MPQAHFSPMKQTERCLELSDSQIAALIHELTIRLGPRWNMLIQTVFRSLTKTSSRPPGPSPERGTDGDGLPWVVECHGLYAGRKE